MLDDLIMFRRFVAGLRRFLRTPLSPSDCRRLIQESLSDRERSFLLLIRKAVYEYPGSPYLALLKWAGVEFGDLERLVSQDGIEGALGALHTAGVWVGLEEVKGQRPIERPGFTQKVEERDFDNPLLVGEFETTTGGSTGPRRRMPFDFHQLVHETACKFLYHEANGIAFSPYALWRGVPPFASGLKNALALAKWGNPVERWFSPTAVSWKPNMLKSTVLGACAIRLARLHGYPIPAPEHVPLGEARRVATWLAGKVRQGLSPVLGLPASASVRVCRSAKEAGLDIAGTVFRVGGEPYTEAKLRVLEELGARAVTAWSMAEAGSLGGGCAAPEVPDEVHLFSGKIAVVQRSRPLSDGESRVNSLYLTTLLTSAPKIMLNLDTGDYGVLNHRRCGCLMDQAGLDLHLHTIRSYEKLTTGGMHFMGSRLLTLVEEILPAKHGGVATDYQIVEQEQGALSEVTVVISPRVGEVDDRAVKGTILQFLASGSRSNRSMAEHWRQGDTIRVIRGEPYATDAGKVPALRILRE